MIRFMNLKATFSLCSLCQSQFSVANICIYITVITKNATKAKNCHCSQIIHSDAILVERLFFFSYFIESRVFFYP